MSTESAIRFANAVLSATARRTTMVRPLTVAHRVLRALRHTDMPLTEIDAHVREDGHPVPAATAVGATLTNMRNGGLVVYELPDGKLRGGLYGLSTEGERVLKVVELEIVAAKERLAAGLPPMRPAAPAQDSERAERMSSNIWDLSDDESRRLLARGIPRQTATATNPLQPIYRPGAMDHERWPSRMGDRLHYRDGRVTDMADNPITKRT